MDYKNLGLKIGLEIHQQLDTNKLFCSCPSELVDKEPDLLVRRKLHAVAGELGAVDPAAIQAHLKDISYVYQFFSDSNCLVELDEEPPHPMNQDALDIVLKVALMLNSNVVDEIHVMRKTVIDGSNTSGFQRTALVALSGFLKLNNSKNEIQTICIEEDAARKVGASENEIIYSLDRLGIPLIEIATAPDIHSPEEAKEVAKAIGSILRATGKVKRGIGTIRQDLNVSIKNGARVEIKGVQELNLIPEVVRREIKRQSSLLEIKDELKKRNAKKVSLKIFDLTNLLKDSNSKVVKKATSKGGVIYGIKLEKFSGLLGKEVQPGRRFGSELADYARAYGAGGIFHSDELPAYGITAEEVSRIRESLKVNEKDAFVLIADRKETCEKALNSIVDRTNFAFAGVPNETRKALPDGNTSYMRPLAGGARMYPETDLSPIVITKNYLKKLGKELPKLPWETIKELQEKFSMPKEIASELYDSSYFELFNELIQKVKVEPKLIASTFVNVVPSISSPFVLQKEQYLGLFKELEKGKFSKEAIPEILDYWSSNPKLTLDEIIEKLGLKGISKKELESLIKKIANENQKLIKEKGERAIQPLMGLVMKEVRGKADGKLVMEILKKVVNEI